MDRSFNSEARHGFHLRDSRAVLATLAMLISGVLLSLMAQQYFTTHETGIPFTRSRMWWEVVLNVQLLSIGMMWFSYSDTIPDTPGPLRRLQITRRLFSVGSVAMPSIVLICNLHIEGFQQVPGPQLIAVFAPVAALYFAVSIFLRRRVERLFSQHSTVKMSLPGLLVYFSPLLVLGGVAVVDASRGGWLCFVFAPTLLYLQGAMPYILHAIGTKEFTALEQV